MTLVTATVKDKTTVTAATNSVTVSGSSPVTEQINGVTIGTVASGGTNNQVIENTDGTTVGTTANPSVVGDSTATVNGVSMATIPAEGTENIEVRQETGATLVGSQQGQFWRIDNSQAQVNGVNTETIPATVTHNQVIHDSAGASVGTEANPSVIADASVTVNSAAFDTVVAEGTIDVPVEYVNGTPVGTINAGVVQIPNPATPPSVSLAISDTTPDFGDTITLTATATNFTGAITYHFIVKDYLGNWSKITQVSDNTYDYTCPYAGTFNIHVICEDSIGNTASACESITVGTFAAKYAFTAGWSGVGMSDIVSDRLNSLTDIVSATYTATAPSATERPIAQINAVTDEASTFRAGDNDNRLQTSLTSIANNVLIAFCFDFTNNEDQGDFNTLTLIGGDGGATEGSRFIISMRDNSVLRNIFFYLMNGSVSVDAAITETVTHGRNICVMKYDHATTTLRVILNGTTTTASNASGTLWAAAGDYQLLNSRANGRAFPEPVHAIYIKNSASSISDADQDAAYADLLLKYPNP